VAPLVSVIIVNWNTRDLLDDCLKSVYENCAGLAYETWVVDNSSRDDSLEFLAVNHPQVSVIANNANVGFAAANNQALDRCRGQYALLLNSDAQLLPEAAQRLIAVLESRAQAGAVGPMLVNPDGSFQAGPRDDMTLLNESLLALGASRLLRDGHYPGHVAGTPAGAYAWVGGACVLLRRTAWEQVGKFDPEYFMYTEEADWCWRARQAGWTIYYEPSARVLHVGGGSSYRVSAAMRAQLYKSKLLFFVKNRPRWQALAMRAILMTTASIKAVMYTALGRIQSARKSGYAERAGSFRQVYDAVRAVPIPSAVG
jgi:GT2 family glycosyltransferase